MTSEIAETKNRESSLAGLPRREFSYFFSPEEKMFQIVVKMKDEPGALGQILNLLRDRITLVNIHAYSNSKGEAILSGFARHVSTAQDAASLERVIMMAPLAIECRVMVSSDGLLVDSFHTGIETDYGERLILFRWDAFNRMFDRMAEVFGTGGGEVMLYYEGIAIGEMYAQEMIRRFGKGTVNRNMPSIIKMLSASGWGNASLKFSEGSPIVRIGDCFESSTRKRVRHGCYFMKGMITGVAKVVLGTEVRCDETKCSLRGEDCCEFTIAIDSAKSRLS